MAQKDHYSQSVRVFREQRLPVTATPAGYAALIDAYDLHVPLPRTLSATGERHRTLAQAGWRIFSPRHVPPASLAGHLTFALKHEGLDLAVLKRLFRATGPAPIEAIVRASPTGATHGASGSCTNGSPAEGLICRMPTAAPIHRSSTRNCNSPQPPKIRRAIASRTTCPVSPSSAPSCPVPRPWTASSSWTCLQVHEKPTPPCRRI